MFWISALRGVGGVFIGLMVSTVHPRIRMFWISALRGVGWGFYWPNGWYCTPQDSNVLDFSPAWGRFLANGFSFFFIGLMVSAVNPNSRGFWVPVLAGIISVLKRDASL